MKIHVKNEGVLKSALMRVRADFDYNVIWKRAPEYSHDDRQGREVFNCTLTVKDSRGPGSRVGMNGRRISAACWHVHGYFFDYIFEYDPTAMIEAAGEKITIEGGNWQDRDIGSMMFPLYYSQACDCE